jgi:hypothetical protein
MLLSPPADRILASTSWARARALAPSLVSSGILTGAAEAQISLEQLRGAAEVRVGQLSTAGGRNTHPLAREGGARGVAVVVSVSHSDRMWTRDTQLLGTGGEWVAW